MKYNNFFDWLKKNFEFLQFSLREGEVTRDPVTGETKTGANLTAWWQQFGVGTLLLSIGLFMLIRLRK